MIDTNGHPIAEALVAIESGPSRPDIASETGVDGWFALAGLHPGRYLLRGEAEGFAPGFAEVTIVAKQRASVTIPLHTTTKPDEDDEWFESVSEELGGGGDDDSGFDR